MIWIIFIFLIAFCIFYIVYVKKSNERPEDDNVIKPLKGICIRDGIVQECPPIQGVPL